jgi:DNA-directed RNA polymerase subunit beta'
LEAKEFSALRISLASPEQIESWSYGEVTKPETINYRRLRPEKDGLFCEAIFGPTRDWQCYCGKYKNIRYKGIVCDKCGVEVTRSSVRRERMGHIKLAAPVAHVWYTRRVPSYLGLLLDVSRRNLDRVLYFAQFVITSVDEDARQKALQRIERELDQRKSELGIDVQRQQDDVTAERDQQLVAFDTRQQDVNTYYDTELTRLSSEAMSKAKVVQERIEGLLGQEAPTDILFELANTVIVTRGEQVSNDALRRIQGAATQFINDLQAELDNARTQELEKIAEEADMVSNLASNRAGEYAGELDDRLQTITAQAEKARAEVLDLKVLQFLSEARGKELRSKYGQVFQADMGAEAFHKILSSLNLDKLAAELWNEVRNTRSKQRKKKATKRLRVVESLRKSSNRPEWMILTMLPVIPPDLRPMVQLDGGRFATSDLNDLYRRVINRNNRLKHLLELGAPDVIVRNEKRMLQEAVDSLIDNSQRGKALSRRGRRELKSLSDMLKGKKGRFRRNLLGKRVDYSGRSVIVIGPKLKLHQCGLPKTMALELYRPFVISRLVRYNYANNVKGAKRIIEREKPEVWEVLEEVIKERPVLLNRAPTLHRLGIQAFEPQLVEGKAIQIHPLVCSAFNADFDGDQMAVHVPLSDKAVQEARELMLSTKNLLKPADGQSVVGPSKDMVLGIYYLTMDPTVEIIARADNADKVRNTENLADPSIKVGLAFRSNGYYYAQYREVATRVIYEDTIEVDDKGRKKVSESAVDRTVRAVLDGEVDCMLANTYEMRKYIKKHKLGDKLVITNLHERRHVVDMDEVFYLYNLGLVGLHTSILLGNIYDDNRSPQDEPEVTTVGRAIFNRILPNELRFVQETLGKKGLQSLVDKAYRRVGGDRTTEIVDQIKNLGFRYATISGTTIAVTDLTIPEERADILANAESVVEDTERGFRRGLLTEEERYQITVDTWNDTKDSLQELIRKNLDLAGMRGLMADPSGRIIDLPIRSHFREGLTALEYFISTHGARKGLADTALRTADAGYLTRRLVDVAQDVIVNRTDCGTERNIIIRRNDDVAGQTVYERIIGRCAGRDIVHPETGELIVARNELIDEDIAEIIQNSTLVDVHVRSPMTCALIHGICALCYGRDLGRGEMVEIGSAVGIVAAQSIGEPGTQLTLRTFHSGGTAQASGDITSGLPRVEELFEARKKPKGEAVVTDIAGILRLSKRDTVRIATVIDEKVYNEEFKVPVGWSTVFDDATNDALADRNVREGEMLAWSPDQSEKLIAKMSGVGHLEGHTLYLVYRVRNEEEYELPSSARLIPGIEDGITVFAGQQLTEGSKNPHRILRLLGAEQTQLYLLSEVQKVYRNQGVNIADKHFEVVIRKMLSKVQITKSGDSPLLPGELIDRLFLIDMNEKLRAVGKDPAAGVPMLLGITKAALSTDSFLSAASFQHTIKVLAGAAIEGKQDRLYGLKENVIIGKLIPAGTGFHTYQDRELVAPNTTLEAQGALDSSELDYLDDSEDADAIADRD